MSEEHTSVPNANIGHVICRLMSGLLVTFERLAGKGKRKLACDPISLHPTRVASIERVIFWNKLCWKSPIRWPSMRSCAKSEVSAVRTADVEEASMYFLFCGTHGSCWRGEKKKVAWKEGNRTRSMIGNEKESMVFSFFSREGIS